MVDRLLPVTRGYVVAFVRTIRNAFCIHMTMARNTVIHRVYDSNTVLENSKVRCERERFSRWALRLSSSGGAIGMTATACDQLISCDLPFGQVIRADANATYALHLNSSSRPRYARSLIQISNNGTILIIYRSEIYKSEIYKNISGQQSYISIMNLKKKKLQLRTIFSNFFYYINRHLLIMVKYNQKII